MSVKKNQTFAEMMSDFYKNMGSKIVTDTINGQTFTGEVIVKESNSDHLNERGDMEVSYQQSSNEHMKIECFYHEDGRIQRKNVLRKHINHESGEDEYYVVAVELFEYDEKDRLIKVTTDPFKDTYTLYTYYDSPTDKLSLKIDKRDNERVLSKSYDKKMRIVAEELYKVTDKNDLNNRNNLIRSTTTSYHGRYRKVTIYEPASKTKSVTHYRTTDNAVIFEYFKEPGKPAKERRAWYKNKDFKVIRGFEEYVGLKMVSRTDFEFDDKDRVLGYDIPNGSGRLDFIYFDDVEVPYVGHVIKDADGNISEISYYKEDGTIMETYQTNNDQDIYYYKAEENDILYIINPDGSITWGFSKDNIKVVFTSNVLDLSYTEGNVEHTRKYMMFIPEKNELYNYLYGIFKELNPFEDYRSTLAGKLFKNGFTEDKE